MDKTPSVKQRASTSLLVTAGALVLWTLALPELWVASVLFLDTMSLVTAFFFPWLVGVIVLGVLYVVQR